MTEKQKLLQSYDFYLNMSGRKSFAEFEYTFVFDEHEVIYKYSKTDVNTLKSESLSIDGKEVIFFDFLTRDGFTLLEGSDTLNASIKNESPISRVKYVNSNSILTDNEQNQVFKKFIDFVERMLLFYSLDSRGYEVKRIRIHDLRHSHISLLIDMGFSAVAIADRVGHESIEITYQYAHLFPSKQTEMADKLDMERGEDYVS